MVGSLHSLPIEQSQRDQSYSWRPSPITERWKLENKYLGFLDPWRIMSEACFLCGSSEGPQWDWAPVAYSCNPLGWYTLCWLFGLPHILTVLPAIDTPKTTCALYLVLGSVLEEPKLRHPLSSSFSSSLIGRNHFQEVDKAWVVYPKFKNWWLIHKIWN